MAVALRQEDTPTSGGTVASLQSNAYAAACATGSVLEVWLAYATGGGLVTAVTDTASQNYTMIGRATDATDGSIIELWAFYNNASATALKATATWSASASFTNIHQREISGAKNQAPDTSNFPTRIVTPGTGANAISIALTNANQPALISAYVCAVGGSWAGVAGTGFTGTIAFQNGQGFSGGLWETKRVTSATSNPSTWTDSSDGGTSTYLGGAVVWDEQASATGPTGIVGTIQGSSITGIITGPIHP